MKYYCISLRHTHPDDAFFTFHRENYRGYCWYISWAGLFEEGLAEMKHQEQRGYDNHYPEESIGMLLEPYVIDGTVQYVLPNNKTVRNILKISKKELKNACSGSCTTKHYDYFKIKNATNMQLLKVVSENPELMRKALDEYLKQKAKKKEILE